MGCGHIVAEENKKWINGRSKGFNSYTDKKEYNRLWAEQDRKKNPEKWMRAETKYKNKNPDKVKSFQKNWRDKNKDYQQRRAKENTAYYLWDIASKRARKKNLEFTIDVYHVSVPEFCPVLGLKLEIQAGIKANNSPSIDRIDNSKGYIPGNIRVISMRANWIKGDATVEELEKVLQYMKDSK